MHKLSIVLVEPDIPGNTGSIGRTCVALNLELILIRPYGFELSEKALRRAGLDYWKHVNLSQYDNWQQFIDLRKPRADSIFLFSRFSNKNIYNAQIKSESFLVFGSETKGLSDHIKSEFSENIFCLPMYSEHIRSLNLANCATAVAYEAIRQIEHT